MAEEYSMWLALPVLIKQVDLLSFLHGLRCVISLWMSPDWFGRQPCIPAWFLHDGCHSWSYYTQITLFLYKSYRYTCAAWFGAIYILFAKRSFVKNVLRFVDCFSCHKESSQVNRSMNKHKLGLLSTISHRLIKSVLNSTINDSCLSFVLYRIIIIFSLF